MWSMRSSRGWKNEHRFRSGHWNADWLLVSRHFRGEVVHLSFMDFFHLFFGFMSGFVVGFWVGILGRNKLWK